MRIVSVHIPRTGGTSLWGQFSQIFGNEFLADYDHDPLGSQSRIVGVWPEHVRVMHGHFVPQRYAAASETFLMTFLRHPVPLVIALYCAWKRMRPMHETHARFWREKPSLLSFASWAPIRSLLSETYFGGFDMKRFNFIGFHERRRQDLARLSDTLGIQLSDDWHDNRLEKRAEREELEMDSTLQGQLQQILANDIDFYCRAQITEQQVKGS